MRTIRPAAAITAAALLCTLPLASATADSLDGSQGQNSLRRPATVAAASSSLEGFRLAIWNQDLEWGSESAGPSYWSRTPARSTTAAKVEWLTGRTPFAAYGGANTLNHIAWLWDDSRSAAVQMRSQPVDAVAGRKYTANAVAARGRGSAATFYLEFYNQSGRRLSLVKQYTAAPTTLARTQVSVTGIAPAGTTSARVLVASSTTTTGSSYWDSVSIDEYRGPEGYSSALANSSALLVPGHRVQSVSAMSQVIVPGTKHETSSGSPDAVPVYDGYTKGSPVQAAQLYGTVLQDGGIYKMWFQAKTSSSPWSTWYSESTDGITWARGEEVLRDVNPGGVVRNPDTSDPAKKFLMLSVRGTMQMVPDRKPMPPFDVDYRTWYSADGKDWKPLSNGPALNFRDIGVVTWDAWTRKFIALTKQASGVDRQLFMSTSSDFVHWSTPRRALRTDSTDPRYTDVYTASIFRSGEELVALPVLYSAGVLQGIDGPLRPYLASSVDGVHFDRPTVREPSIPLGRAGSPDAGIITPASSPITLGDTTRLYYGGWTGGHETNPRSPRIFFAEWGRERMAGLRADGTYGSVTTKTLRPSGTQLSVNAHIPEGGRLTATVLDPRTGKVIPGYEAASSSYISGDVYDGSVRWGSRTLAALAGKDLQIRFTATRGSMLYSFKIS